MRRKRNRRRIFLADLYSPRAILLDGETGEVLEEKGSRRRIYPASMTKMMTAIVAIENTSDWDTVIRLSPDMYEMLYAADASLAGFEAGECVTPQDLLYGILLPSGAECCIGYAGWLAGDEDAFVGRMNEKAKELGMKDTHFSNTTGLHERGHYSTVADMSVLLRYCLQNDRFRQVITTASHVTAESREHPGGMAFASTLLAKLTGEELENGRILGGKTGYTSRAGLCLASVAEIGGQEYILVTAGAKGTLFTEPFHILDAVNVYQRIDRGEAGVLR